MTWPWQRSIQARIVLILGGLLSLVLLFVNLEMWSVVSQAQLEESANHLQIQALLAGRNLEDPLSGYSHELEEGDEEHREQATRLPVWTANYARETGAKIVIVDRHGRLLSGDSGSSLTPEERVAAEEGRPLHRWTHDQIYATAPVIQGEHLKAVVRLAIPRALSSARSRPILVTLAGASLIALGVALIAAVWLSRRLVAPLRQLESSALRASRGQLDEVLEVTGQDELASLSRAFATMLSELRVTLERQRRFVSSASHELRTPLTRIKLRSEALANGGLHDPLVADKFVRELDSEVDGLIRLANNLLDLARLEERPEVDATLDCLEVLRAAFESVRLSALDKELTLEAELPDSLPPIRMDAVGLSLVVKNLLDNAVKFTPSGGHVRMRAERSLPGVRLVVEDTGIGIEPQHLAHVFERFYRVGSRRASGGSGLGLALVKAAVESAGGSTEVTSVPGQGTRFVIELPGC